MADQSFFEFFDRELGETLRDEAIERVGENASQTWKSAAAANLLFLCRTQEFLTTDSVWARLNRQGVRPPHEPRAMGAMMRAGAAANWCFKIDKTVMSQRPACHRRPLSVWRSLLYKKGSIAAQVGLIGKKDGLCGP
jgi:hypothetical protein